jgi:MFS family permease
MQAGAIAGPLVGGALIPVLGFSVLYAVDTCTLFATLWAVIQLPPLPIHGAPAGAPGLRAVLDGFAYLRGHQVLLMSFVVDIIAMVFGMPRALFPQVAHESFGGPAEGGLAFALLYAGIPAGAVLGGILSGWVSRVRRQGRAVIGAVLLWGLAMAGFGGAVGLAPHARQLMLLVAVLMLVVGGAADMASSAFRNSMLQSAGSDAVRGRLQGVFIVVVAGGPRIADVVHGGAAAVVGTALTAGVGGLLVIVLVAWCARASPTFFGYRVEAPDRVP